LAENGDFLMKLSGKIKPISYLKAHAAEIVNTLAETRESLVITQRGEARVVIQDIESYEQTQETMALLKILALGTGQVSQGKVQRAEEVIKRVRRRSEGT
jgi:prevent-host-death family protein